MDAGPLISANNAFYDRIGIFPIVNAQGVGGRAPIGKLFYSIHNCKLLTTRNDFWYISFKKIIKDTNIKHLGEMHRIF